MQDIKFLKKKIHELLDWKKIASAGQDREEKKTDKDGTNMQNVGGGNTYINTLCVWV